MTIVKRKRLYLNTQQEIPNSLPPISSGVGVFEVGTNYGCGPSPHRYRFICGPCEVRWSAETKESKCWSCGTKMVLKTNGG